jgi:two-component system cell cycle sensor histidine kinase/response regulator CckA
VNHPSEIFQSSVERIRKAVERATGMVRQLLTFARKSETLFVTVSMNESINGIISMLGSTFEKTIAFKTSLKDGIPDIIADPSQVDQILLNLCVNARDAIVEHGQPELQKGTITITSGTAPGREVQKRFPDARAEQYVVVSVEDTGAGMTETTKQRIFEPFFSTKGPGKGTGLGLAVVYGVVRGHRGFIDVTSTVGKGTKFTLCFPVPAIEVAAVTKKQAGSEQIHGGTETILVVEDEEMLLDSLKVLLEEKGYQVLTARDGEEAVDMYTRHQNDIAFVLVDMGLPKMGGWEAFQEMQRVNPNVKVIFGSGQIDPTFRARMIQAGAVDFIQKPYIPDEVLKRIHEVICN